MQEKNQEIEKAKVQEVETKCNQARVSYSLAPSLIIRKN
jgi:hypothetical protein